MTKLEDNANHRAQQIIASGAWSLPARRMLAGKKLSASQKRLLVAVFSGGYTTALDLQRWGYNTDGSCKYCGRPDSVHRRAWTCPRFEPDREGIDQEILEMAKQEGEADPLFTHLWMPTPAFTSFP
eukprot:7321747-Pyramimonas_sp.AAC.1